MPTQTNNSNQQSVNSQEQTEIKVAPPPKRSKLVYASTKLQLPTDPLGPLTLKLLENLAPERRNPEMDAAFHLHLLGMNVFPQPYGQKAGWPWKPLQYARVHPTFLPILFANDCNLAIMTGRTSRNLVVLDCESEETFEEQGYLLSKSSIPRFSVRTNGSGDGGHYYFHCANGEVANIRSKKLENLEVRGSRCYVLTPSSIHPDTGLSYEWLHRESNQPPVIDMRQVSWLPLKLTEQQPFYKESYGFLYGDDEIFLNLTKQTVEFILLGAPEGTRNDRLFAALCDMIGNDINRSTVDILLSEAAQRSGLDYREIKTTFKSAYSRPRQPARITPLPDPENPEEWELALKWAQNHQWAGRTGQSDRATFIAMCERAKMYSSEKGTFRASTREIAELAQLRRTTVSKCIGRLLAAGYIVPSGLDADTRARLFRFGTFEGRLWREGAIVYLWSSGQWPTHVTFSPQNGFAKNDAFERNALGKTARLVWQHMSIFRKAARPKVIAEMCNLSVHQVYRALRKLEKYKLAAKRNRGWVAVTATAEWLDENVAAVAGTLGRMKARREKHQIDRAIHAGWDLLDLHDVEERQYLTGLVKSMHKES